MFIKSLRFKIILWHTGILFLMLLLLGFVLYNDMRRRLAADIDHVLLSRAEGIVDSIDTYWEAEKFKVPKGNIGLGALSVREKDAFAKMAKNWVSERSDDFLLVNMIISIFDNQGRYVASSKTISQSVQLPLKILGPVLTARSHFDYVRAEIPEGKSDRLRALTIPVMVNGQVAYIVQVGTPLSSLSSALRELKIILFLLLPISIVLSGTAGALLAKITLQPVKRIINTIHQITAENLRMRIAVPASKDEIRRLADTFNEMLERLEQAFTSQQRFFEDLSHELKTPLAVLKGELEVTLKRMRSTREYEATLTSSLEEINRIIRVVEDLLMLARFDNNLAILETSRLDIKGLVGEAAESIRILARQKNIEIRLSGRAGVIVHGDKEKLRRLFLNLLENAVKYSQPGGIVSVQVEEVKPWAQISVADTGRGIPEDEIPNIFERFYRLEKSRSPGGFGLGLSIARSIVEAHKGKIEVKSSVGKGSTFIASLPLTQHA